jgi:hypothetical protein
MEVLEGGMSASGPCIMQAMSVVCCSSPGELASSSSSERLMFAPPIAFTASFSPALEGGCLIFVVWCCVGFAPVVSILARFSVN